MERDFLRTGRIGRTVPLLRLGGQTAGEAVVAALGQRIRGGDGLGADFHRRTAQRYAEHLGRSKGVLMKVGQILSFTSFGHALADDHTALWRNALTRLQDSAPPMATDTVVEVIEKELGFAVDDLFESFDPEPLAAASIGQVHAARTRKGSRDVVVKVQYPGVDEAIRADLRNTELISTFLQLIRGFLPELSQIDPQLVAREVAIRIGEELDYWTEASNQTIFAKAYRDHPFIRVPEVFAELSGERVLTMERSTGRRFSEIDGAPQDLKDRWGETIMRFALGNLRRVRMFHSDPHPGNYLFHDDGSVTFLDYGCVRKYTKEQISQVVTMLDATTNNDGALALVNLTKMGVIDPLNMPSPEDVLAWQRAWLWGFGNGSTPFTFTPQVAAEILSESMSPTGPHREVLTRAGIDPAFVMLTRINLGLVGVLAQLNATAPWESIRDEWDHNGPAATPLGELDVAFWKSRA